EMNDAEDEENMRCLRPYPRSIFLLLLFFSAISPGWSAKCEAPVASASAYRECVCEPVAGDASVTIKCTGQEWTTVPSLSGIYGDPELDKGKPTVVALSIVNSELALLNQDDFKDEGDHIQALDLSGNNILSVNVNAFRKLESKLYQLKLTRNLLTAIPHWALTYLRQLQYLDLQENRIAEIKADTFHEAQLKNLRYLHLDKNQIALLPKGAFHTLPLQVLTLSGNRISEIEKESMPTTLWFLDLKSNLLEEIPYLAMKDLGSLKMLDLESNNISVLAPNAEVHFENELNLLLSNNKIRALGAAAFGSFTRLVKLDLSYNQISSVHEAAFASVASLMDLDLSYNSLVHIPQETFTPFAKSLKSLNMEENDLHALPVALKQLKAMEKLNVNSNKLTGLDKDIVAGFKANLTELFVAFNRLSRIPSDIFDGMTQLRHLDLSKNRIKRVENMAFGAYGGAGTSLVRLNLAGNRIEEVADPGAFLYLSSLAYLDLSYNKIQRLSKASLERLEGLESLFLQNNALTEFPRNALSSLNKLRYLLLDNNKLESVPDFAFQWLVRLERLSLSRNQLRSIGDKTFHVSSTAHLKSLNLGGNRIELLRSNAFSNLENLEQLLLNANRIATIQSRAFHNLPSLRQLDLSHNLIHQLLPHAFVDLALEVLTMSHNRLQAIDESVFFELRKLTHLDLSHNHFTSLDLSVLGSSAQRLKHLDLSNNALTRLNLELAKRSLIRLNLRNNLLHFVDDNLLQGFSQLATIGLAENNIIEVQQDAFKGCPKLERIVLSGNDLGRLWKGTFKHQELIHLLDLSNNFLDSLEADVFGEDNVLALVLKGNNFTRIPVEALASISGRLASLDLSHNALRSLDGHDLENLKHVSRLDLSHNKIDALEEETFRLLPRLKELDLSHNPITTWSPHAFTGISGTLTSLNLAHTGLFSLPRIRAPNLKRLNVSHNHMYEVSTADVETLKRVASVDISNNNLYDLKPDVLAACQI
ncbi:leucine Rich Repeat family protein, partial [Aphelenchoides avenae]